MLSYKDLLYKVYEEEKVELILEALGCQNINFEQGGRLIVATRPCGNNKRSVQVKNIDTLNSCIRSQGVQGSLYDVVMFLNNSDIKSAYDFIMGICGYTEDTEFKQSPLQWMERRRRQREYNERANILEPIDEKILNQYIYGSINQFLLDGIPLDILLEYGVGYCTMERRITIPIYSIYGELVGIKGRKTDDDDDMPKFFFLYPCDQSRTLFNYHRAKYDCILDGEVKLFEAEKSTMQCKAFGVLNTMAIGSSGVSPRQLELLLELECDIVLCYDEGSKYDIILPIYVDFFKGKRKVYVLYNVDNILTSKQSPSDAGINVFEYLYERRVQIC